MHPGTLHPSSGPQEVEAIGNGFLGICFPANQKELMLSCRNPDEGKWVFISHLLCLPLTRAGWGRRRESNFCPLFSCNSDQCVTLVTCILRCRMTCFPGTRGSRALLLQHTMHHCIAQAHSSAAAQFPYREFASSAPSTPSKCAHAVGSREPMGFFRETQGVRVQAGQ